MESRQLLYIGLKEKGFNLTDEQIFSLMEYMNLVLEANKKFNLTAIEEENEFITKHFLDSIFMYDNSQEEMLVADMGTGGGFPGIPLKIVHPKWEMTFIDSTEKKLKFIEAACIKLGIENVEFVHSRAEDVGRANEHREKYDLVFSRAVAPMNVLSEYCLPLTRLGGKFIASKGPKYQEELEDAKKAVEVLGGKVDSISKIMMPYEDIVRYLVICKKIKKTPLKYPRRQGVPSKKPL